jgi:hypothetical protein
MLYASIHAGGQSIGALFLYLAFLGIMVILILVKFSSQSYQRRRARKWPLSEGSIHRINRQVVGAAKGEGPITQPVCSFTWTVNGEGHWGVLVLQVNDDPGQEEIDCLKNIKFPVHFNPKDPDEYYIPVPDIDGYNFTQKMDTMSGFYVDN